jgi:hypothetical protein
VSEESTLQLQDAQGLLGQATLLGQIQPRSQHEQHTTLSP